MNLKRIILLDSPRSHELTMKVHKGFLRKDIGDVMSISSNEWTPKGDGTDKLYFFPGCSVPRIKVREKFTCTIKPTSASAAFISIDNLGSSKNMFDKMTLHFVNRHDLSLFINGLKPNNAHLIPTYHSLLETGIEDVAITTNLLANFYRDYYGLYALDDVLKGESRWSLHGAVKANPDEHVFYKVPKTSELYNITTMIYNETAMLAILNEDKLVITDEKYEDFRMMAASGDTENIGLMMEMIANSNYEKSLPNICFLLAEFKQEVHKQKKQKEQVNFRSLLVYLGIENRPLDNLSIGEFTQILKSKKQFTRFNAFRLSEFYASMTQYQYQRSENSMWVPGPTPTAGYIDK